MAEELNYRVRVLGIDKLVQLNKDIKENAKELRERKKAMKGDEEAQKENMKQVIELTDELKKQRKEFREGSRVQGEVQSQTKKTTSFTMKMATAFGVASLAVDGLKKASKFLGDQIKESIVVFKEFDFQMAKVRAISGATDLEFKRLKSSAEELGRTTFFTATQVAELQTNLSKLGFTSVEILDAQAATLATATAAGEDLGRTATVMGSAIRGFGLDASEATRVADVMATAFTSSALDIEKFQTSMTKVAPIAKMAGFEIEGTTAILASLTDAGIEASIAGTSLRNIFLRLADPTSDLSKRLGGSVSSVDELIPKLKSLKDSNIALSDVLGITDRRTAAAFGRLLDSSEGVMVLTNALRNSSGAAENMAEIVGDSLQGAMLRFKSAVDGFRIALVELFGDRLQDGFDSVARFFNNLASPKNIARFEKLGKAFKNVIKFLAAYTIGTKAAALATRIFAKSAFDTGVVLGGRLVKGLSLAKNGFRALTASIASTGIGLLVIALGELAVNLMKGKSAIFDVVSAQERLNKAQKEGREDMQEAVIQTTALANSKRKLNEMLDNEGKLLDNTAVGQAIYNDRKQKFRLELVNVNKINKAYNQTLLTEKSTIDDIITSTDNLITKMKDRMLQESFQKLSKDFLDQAVSANLLLDEFTQGASVLETRELNIFRQFDDVDAEVKNAKRAIEFLQENQRFTTDISKIPQEDFAKLRAARLRDLLEAEGMTLQEFAEAIEAGFFEEQTSKIQQSLQNQMSEGASLFDTGEVRGDGDPDPLGVNTRREMEMERHNEELLHLREMFINDSNGLKLAEIDEEIFHQEQLKKLLDEEGKETHQIDLKIQKNKLALRNEMRRQELETAQQNFDEDKHILDMQLAENFITEVEHKAKLLELEKNFTQAKKDIFIGDLQMMKQLLDEQRGQELTEAQLQKEAIEQRIADVNELGGALQQLGGVMGENNKLVQIGTKLQQAAALATSIQTLKEKLNTQTKAASIATSATKTTANAAETVSKAATTTAFPANLAAIAATIGVLVAALSLFGGGGRNVDEEGAENFFAKGGLTKGGMFRGASHANGGVKFAVGGRIHEAEGGEAIINKRSTARFRPILSAINSYNGNGVKFADGGVISSGEKFALGGELANIQRMVSGSGVTQKVVMVESDVTSTQSRVSSLESQASF